MKLCIPLFLVLGIALCSCRTQQLLFSSDSDGLDKQYEFVVVRNDTSRIIPVAVYPEHKLVDQFVIRAVPAIVRIDSLIYHELVQRGLSVRIVNQDKNFQNGFNYITYQDYWAWDFKKYMHVLKIRFYNPKNGEQLMEMVSEGNKMGMHDYPNPRKQVPGLIDKALNYKTK